MAKILVLTDAPNAAEEMLLSEHLDPVHLESRHSGDQLLERLAWAVRDAQRAERLATRSIPAPDAARPADPDPDRVRRRQF